MYQCAGSLKDSGGVTCAMKRSVMAQQRAMSVWPGTRRSSFLRHVEVGDAAVSNLRGKEYGLRQRRMSVDGKSDVFGIGTHFQRHHGLGNQLARVRTDDPCTEQAAR